MFAKPGSRQHCCLNIRLGVQPRQLVLSACLPVFIFCLSVGQVRLTWCAFTSVSSRLFRSATPPIKLSTGPQATSATHRNASMARCAQAENIQFYCLPPPFRSATCANAARCDVKFKSNCDCRYQDRLMSVRTTKTEQQSVKCEFRLVLVLLGTTKNRRPASCFIARPRRLSPTQVKCDSLKHSATSSIRSVYVCRHTSVMANDI